MSCGDRIEVNGKAYVAEKANGKRFVVVVDRGWIFAGDVERKNGRIFLSRVVWPMHWAEVGFDGVLKDPKNAKVKLRKIEHSVEIPEDGEIFSVPVDDNWGL